MKKHSSYCIVLPVILAFCGCKAPASSRQDGARSISRQETCIQAVIRQDSALGATRDRASEQAALSQVIRDYIRGIEEVPFRDCPPSFTTAFQKHVQAWSGLLPLTDKYPQLRGELHHLFTRLENGPDGEEFRRRLKAVWDTWAEVEAAGKDQR